MTLYAITRIAAALLVAAYIADVATYIAARTVWRRRRSDT